MTEFMLIDKLKSIEQWSNPIPIQNVDYTVVGIVNREYTIGVKIPVEGASNVNKELFAILREPDEAYNEVLSELNVFEFPIAESHPNYPEYKTFRIYKAAKKRDISVLEQEIKAKETETNNILKQDGQYIKANDYATMYAIMKSDGEDPSDQCKNAKIRINEIVERLARNQSNAIEMIRKARLVEYFDINIGWEIDTLTPL